MAEKNNPMIEKELHDGSKIKIVGVKYEPGKPDQPGYWRDRFTNRDEMLKYLANGERYWSGEEGFGSEKRKSPA